MARVGQVQERSTVLRLAHAAMQQKTERSSIGVTAAGGTHANFRCDEVTKIARLEAPPRDVRQASAGRCRRVAPALLLC